MLKLLIFLVIFVKINALSNEADTVIIDASTENDTSSPYRLPTNLIPDLYNLEIKTYFDDEFKFEGNVKIRFICYNETSDIKLHINELKIDEDKVKVFNAEENELKIKEHIYEPINNFYIIRLEENLQSDETYRVEIPYNAVLSTGLAGYYRSSYKEKETGATKWLSITQHEPQDARRSFPCFDEPQMKAKFRISLIRQNNYRSISNMPLVNSEQLEDGWTKDNFAESVPMSTYLVAFCVTQFASLESTIGDVHYRVWARPDAIRQAIYSLDVVPKLLNFFEQYFDVKYALPKVDMIAIPDFNSGAMENWGLITYRETAMLFDEKVSAASAKESVTRVISHELAHQWFGNLVTMKWWDDLWLNEGFATYAAALGLANIEPKWGSLDDQAVEAMLTVFSLDALESSHPVSVKIKHPSEILQIFDPISYSKGAFLLRSISHFLGQETFRKGVIRYLRVHKFANAEQDMLWSALEEQSQIDNLKSGRTGRALLQRGSVKEIMDSWTLQTGYPVVTVSRDYDSNSATVSQRRFLTDWFGRNAAENPLWWVPLSYVYSGEMADTKPKAWLYDNATVINELPDKDHWLLFNVNATALYRVNYDAHNWKLLSNALLDNKTRTEIPVLNRAQLIDDALDLARAGLLDYNSALDVLRYLRDEHYYLPWRSAFSNLAYFIRMTRRTAGYGPFREFMNSLLEPVYKELGEKPFRARAINDLLPDTKHRTQLISWSCSVGIKDCEDNAMSLYNSWLSSQNEADDEDSNNPIPVDLRGAVYCTAVRLGGQKAWEFFWQRYLTANVAAEKSKLLNALGCTKELWLLHKFLNMSLDEKSGLRRQDASQVFSAVARSSSGYYVAKDFFTTRIQNIYEFLGPKANRLGRYLAALAESMNTEYDLQEMKRFIEENDKLFTSAKLQVKQSLENIAINIKWRNQHYDTVVNWLAQHTSNLFA